MEDDLLLHEGSKVKGGGAALYLSYLRARHVPGLLAVRGQL